MRCQPVIPTKVLGFCPPPPPPPLPCDTRSPMFRPGVGGEGCFTIPDHTMRGVHHTRPYHEGGAGGGGGDIALGGLA